MRKVITALRLLTVLALGGVAGCSGGPLTSGDITVVAQFDSGAGLYVGNAVAVLGMPVGEVTAIAPTGTHVEVTMRIDREVPIPADATAVTLSTSVLTDRHVEFSPPYRGGETLRDGARLPIERTRTPVGIDRLISVADRMSGDLAGETPEEGPIAGLLAVAAAGTSGNGADLRATMDELSKALRLGDDAGAHTRDTVTQLVDELSELVAAAAAGDAFIRDFGAASGQLGTTLAELGIGAGTTGAQVNQLMLQAEDLLTTNRAALQTTMADATIVTRALTDYRTQLAEFLDVTPLLLDNGYRVVDQQNGGVRIHALLDKVAFDGQMIKEVCNILGLRQLGCSTGTLQDFGPDFGLTDMLEAMTRLPR